MAIDPDGFIKARSLSKDTIPICAQTLSMIENSMRSFSIRQNGGTSNSTAKEQRSSLNYVTLCGIHSDSLTFSASVYLGLKSAFQERTSVLAYPLPFLCHFFCSEVIRNAFSCSA
jgi:hypothetical protein